MVLWTHMVSPLNSILTGSADFAQLTHMPNTQTHTDHATCDIIIIIIIVTIIIIMGVYSSPIT